MLLARKRTESLDEWPVGGLAVAVHATIGQAPTRPAGRWRSTQPSTAATARLVR